MELFDKVLWPGEDSLLEEVTSSNRMPAGPAGKFPHQPPMLLTLVQLSLLVLASVHPSDPAAAANANRLRRLIQWLLQQPGMAVRGKNAHWKMNDIQRRHWVAVGTRHGVVTAEGQPVDVLLDELVARTPGVINDVRRGLPCGFHPPVVDSILAGVAGAAQRLST